jgi:hypothetical protein
MASAVYFGWTRARPEDLLLARLGRGKGGGGYDEQNGADGDELRAHGVLQPVRRI